MEKPQLIVLFAVIIIGCTIAFTAGIPLKEDLDNEKVVSCKNLCSQCNCVGFYCGEECLCECSDQNDDGNV